jgi:hypothetical protein
MGNCVICGVEHSEEPEMCRECWYSGAYLARNLRGVLAVLEQVTGTPWEAAHTGGGCFWLATPPYSDDDSPHANLVITAWPDVLDGSATVAEVEKDGGWLLSAFPHGHDSEGDSRTWPDDAFERGLGTEELPVAVGEAVVWLTGMGVRFGR